MALIPRVIMDMIDKCTGIRALQACPGSPLQFERMRSVTTLDGDYVEVNQRDKRKQVFGEIL